MNEVGQLWGVFKDDDDPKYFIVFSEYNSRESEAEHVELWSSANLFEEKGKKLIFDAVPHIFLPKENLWVPMVD